MRMDHEKFICSLIAAPEQVESYFCINILNFYGFPFKLEEENMLFEEIKKEMGMPQDTPYPMLFIDSAAAGIQSTEQAGHKDILEYLLN